jgi:hypothetical protein
MKNMDSNIKTFCAKRRAETTQISMETNWGGYFTKPARKRHRNLVQRHDDTRQVLSLLQMMVLASLTSLEIPNQQ